MDSELLLDDEETSQINQMMEVARGLLADQVPTVCGDCFYYTKDRTCRRHSPKVIISNGLPMTIYPRVQERDFSCGDAVKGQRVYPEDK